MRRCWKLGGILALVSFAGQACAASPSGPAVSGQRALRHVQELVRAGPRTVGSAAHGFAEEYIDSQLRKVSATVEMVEFTAQTPRGMKVMRNIIGEIPGETDQLVVIASHYDTLARNGFLGANDGGSSTGLLLELARVFSRRKNHLTLRFVFFDGEEAFHQWSASDSLYGSRHQAQAWRRDGTAGRIRAFILLDMIGDKNLNLARDLNSTGWLTDLVWSAAKEMGYGEHFTENVTAMEDDHLPFVEAGVPAVDLIDFDYGPNNRYWHTPEDTVDKIGGRSLEIVGEVVVETVRRLEKSLPAAAH